MACAPGTKKRIMHKYLMKELSGVPKPAMEGAKALIIKADQDMSKVMFDEALQQINLQSVVCEAMQEMWSLNDALRMSISDIITNPTEYPDTMAAIKESLSQFADAVAAMCEDELGEVEDPSEDSTEDPAEEGMAKGKKEGGKEFPAGDYAYVPDPEAPSTWKLRLTSQPGGSPDPRIVGAAVAALGAGFRGNKVQIPSADKAAVKRKVKSAWLKANPGKSSEDLPEVLKQEETMSKERTVEVVEAELAISKAYGELSDAEKVHYNRLDESGKAAFLKMAKDARTNELNKAAESDPVVYTSDKGIVFRKSDDIRFVEMAKENDATNRELQKSREEKATLEFEKKADGEFKDLPGDKAAKVALLKAVDSIQDKTVRENVTSILKSHAETFKPAFETRGANGSAHVRSLEAMAKERQKADPSLTYEKAYAEVLETPEGQKLYESTLS